MATSTNATLLHFILKRKTNLYKLYRIYLKVKVSETQKHLICVSTVETLTYVLESLIYVSETHKCFYFMHA
jgi:hypothetical protein